MIPPSALPPIASRGTDPIHVRPAPGAPAAGPGPSPTARPNPSMQIDPSLGIVVMEFRDRSGAVTSTLPTQRELDAYRSAQRDGSADHPGTAPRPPAPGVAPEAPQPDQGKLQPEAASRSEPSTDTSGRPKP